MDGLIALRDAFNNQGAPAATFEGYVFFTRFVFQREYSSLSPVSAPENRSIDTATIAVHELLHVAGLKDPQVQNLNRQIHEHCGFTLRAEFPSFMPPILYFVNKLRQADPLSLQTAELRTEKDWSETRRSPHSTWSQIPSLTPVTPHSLYRMPLITSSA
jgi:hypothetical protein